MSSAYKHVNIRDTADIGSNVYHANIISKAMLEVSDIRMHSASILENTVICKETVTKQLKVSDLKMPCTLTVGNKVICNKIVNQVSLREMVFLNMN